MKSSKTSRPPLQKTRLSRETTSSHGALATPNSIAAIDPSADDQRPNVPRKQSEIASPLRSVAVHTQVTTLLAQDSQGLEVMKRRMGEALAKKQEQISLKQSPDASPAENMSPKQLKSPANPSQASSHATSTDSLPSTSATISTDSARTVRAPFDATPGTVRTPSYPFPRMNMRLQRGLSSRSGPHHRPFTLLSPTNEPPEMHGMEIERRDSAVMNSASDTSTPMGQESSQADPEDPNHPTPDLYDMVLMLSTEPGLESWWANVTEILTEAYGAERASLALPGDITDLENVPWGQKASFGINGSDSGDSTNVGSNVASEADNVSLVGELGPAAFSTEKPGLALRPPLTTRHSIAGVAPEKAFRTSPIRPHGPMRATSTMSGFQQPQDDLSTIPKLTKQSPTPQVSQAEEDLNISSRQDLLSTATSAPRCYVYRTLQRLEAEPDPLLVRTGVSTLFGKRKPVVLTRAYTDEKSHTPQKENPYARQPYREREGSTATIRAFEEYEQPEPSPWSQSPSPSPAARPDPAESPFFTHSATVDEDAFSANPPSYNYGASANQSLNAIGTDSSKTLIHIPLIQPVPSRKVLVSSLRFPVAILSFLSPVTPYPRNLRHSLYALLPHLASTFSLAHQYSNMQERLRGGGPRASSSFGLGGTFSDEGSELELVTELSTQIQHEKALSKASSLAGSVYSPSDKASVSRTSPPGSIAGTPLLDEVGMSSHFPPTPSKTGSEMVEGYFSAKRNRSGILNAGKQATPTTPGGKNPKEVSPERQRKPDRAQPVPQSSSKKQNVSVDTIKGRSEAQNQNNRSASLTSEASYEQTPTSAVDRVEFRRLLHRDSLKPDEGERNLPELIAALMLNAVPLQLFLAKPSNGDLVWTNRKFDAFRSQGEGRVKDPWKNVHSEDQPELIKMWKQALRTGNQFTHYIRVKRFNSDSDFRWFVFRASTMLSNNGRLLYWVGSFLDVHEQYVKNLEAQDMQATMARDSKIRALADAIPQVLFEAVEGEGIVAVNQQWHIFSGQTLEEARGVGFARHVHRDDLHKCGMLAPSDVPRAASESSQSTTSSQRTMHGSHRRSRSLFAPDDAALATMIQQGSVTAEKDENGRVSYTTEIRLRSKKGEFRWFLVRLVKVEDGQASWYGTCTDIELRINLERDLNEANKKVHMEMESKTKFFANMSHEIRTPLNGILGSMPWLVESQLDHDQRRTLDTIQNSANNLRELVDNILDVTKVEAGKMTLLPKWFDVRSLCEEVVDTCSSRAIERGLELNYTLSSDVPPTVKGDPFRLRQVLLNLMGNSVKFTQEGEVYLRCAMKAQPTANETFASLNFDVVDTGRGFNETEFKRLFKQFGQIEGASQHDAGSGLGLFLSKQLVEMHGGELSVTSKVGEGSTFSFYIRVETTAPGQREVSPEHPLRPSHRHSVSFGTSPSRSGAGTPTLPASSKTVVHTPGLSKYVSPPAETPAPPSPAVTSPFGVSDGSASVVSFRTASNTVVTPPSLPSNLPTPESFVGTKSSTSNISEKLASIPSNIDSRSGSLPSLHRAQSDTYGLKAVNLDAAHPQTYSIVVICPMEHARLAIKQHIEHVVPHQIPVNVTALSNINAFLELRHGPSPPTFTHIVLDLPASSDIMLFMRQIAAFSAAIVPALVIVTDHYQKRDIAEDFMMLTSSGKKAFLVHKPVKPSVFAMIFDPAQLRNLSKDRVREVAQNSSDDFKTTANHVKETIGKRFRLLLVEDSDTNRMVIQRYLKRVELASDEARDGQECVDKVRARPHGYYNLIICDIQMPKKNGYEACVEIRQWEKENAYPSLPIMALTANAMPEERAAAGAAGFSDYLTKPVDFNRLGRMMITLLDPSIPHTSLKDQNGDTGKPG